MRVKLGRIIPGESSATISKIAQTLTTHALEPWIVSVWAIAAVVLSWEQETNGVGWQERQNHFARVLREALLACELASYPSSLMMWLYSSPGMGKTH